MVFFYNWINKILAKLYGNLHHAADANLFIKNFTPFPSALQQEVCSLEAGSVKIIEFLIDYSCRISFQLCQKINL